VQFCSKDNTMWDVVVCRNQELRKIFSSLQEESSNRSYAEILARLLCMVLRSLENNMHYKPLTDRQRGLAVKLKEALDNAGNSSASTADILQGPFHALCVALFCRMNHDDGRSEHGLEECPVYRFLMFASLRGFGRGGGGGFVSASSVTPICARLQFIIRLVVYHEIFKQTLKDDQQREQEWQPQGQQQEPQQQGENNSTAAAVDDARRRWEARAKQREQWLGFVHANKHTPFAAVHDIFQVANGVVASSGLSGMSQIFLQQQPLYSV
jgi:hypothetical protein